MGSLNSLDEIDRLLKAGDTASAIPILKVMTAASPAREARLPLARLCRRAGLIEDGLRLLTKLVRGKNLLRPPSALETAEYAMLLAWNGSHGEALQLLEALDPAQVPDVFLHKAFCHILQWNYAQAAVELHTVVVLEKDPYKLLIARVNLASALLNEGNLAEAESLATSNIEQARKLEAHRLLGNSLEVRSQIWLRQGRHDLCAKDLDEAETRIGGSSWDRSFIRKWRSVSQALQTKDPAPLMAFRQEAVRFGQWESIRETDFYLLKVQFDQYRLDHLRIGTPFPSYRRRIAIEFGVEPVAGFLLGGPSPAMLNLENRDAVNVEDPGPKICQLLQILARDLYAPIKLGEIFTLLYSGEYFDIHSSPARVRQILRRARVWSRKCETGIQVTGGDSGYRLVIEGPVSIYLPSEGHVKDEADVQLSRLTQRLPARPFSSEEAAKALTISLSQFTRYAKTLIERGRLNRYGSGRYTRYQVLP